MSFDYLKSQFDITYLSLKKLLQSNDLEYTVVEDPYSHPDYPYTLRVWKWIFPKGGDVKMRRAMQFPLMDRKLIFRRLLDAINHHEFDDYYNE